MAYEKHDITIMVNDKDKKTKEFKGVWLYRNRFGELKDYVNRSVV